MNTHIRAYQAKFEKQTGFWPVLLRPCDIRVYMRDPSRPIVCLNSSETPDILHGSYLVFTSNLPLHRIASAYLRKLD